jgi:hypothetical protein
MLQGLLSEAIAVTYDEVPVQSAEQWGHIEAGGLVDSGDEWRQVAADVESGMMSMKSFA